MTERFVTGERGVTLLAVVFLITIAAGLGLAAAWLTQSGQVSLVKTRKTYEAFYAARSGLEWAAQTADGYTTADRDRWLALDGVTMDIAGQGGPRFTLAVAYADPDNDPATADTVTVTSAGYPGGQAASGAVNEMRIVFTVLPPASGALFADEFDQPDTAFFDANYQFAAAAGPHGAITPYTTATGAPGGDTEGLFTHPSEPGGAPGALRMGGQGEARLYIHAGGCLKWVEGGLDDVCAYPECETRSGCQARHGLDAAADEQGYQNYFIKLRARLVHGAGFGVYFRAAYPDENDPAAIDFSRLSAYAWQYDSALGYLSPCDMTTAMFGSDGQGTLASRKVFEGQENCPAQCGLFTAPGPGGVYPFFCPENRDGLPELNGWRWTNADWTGGWRTVYLYLYRGRATIYVDRELGASPDPEPVATVLLDGIGAPLLSGGVGFRVWDGSLAEIDYLRIYPNDDDKDIGSFPGDP